jgi:uncharacterized protein
MQIRENDKLLIHCYKHDGSIHKSWSDAIVLDVKDDCIVLGNNNSLVINEDGKIWRTKEPAIMFFFKNRWFNIIAQLKEKGIYYYCNIASPYIIEANCVKFIDYDLDLRIFPNGSFKVLDKNEYEYHKEIMNYSNEIDDILKRELSSLINIKRNKEYPFNAELIKKYYVKYQNYVDN